jgi:hypothetical protein
MVVRGAGVVSRCEQVPQPQEARCRGSSVAVLTRTLPRPRVGASAERLAQFRPRAHARAVARPLSVLKLS